MARADLDAIEAATNLRVGFTACRSKLAEVLEKTMKAELIRLGWPLERTHDLEQLLDELVGRSSDLIPCLEPLCDALAEAYFTDRYPGFDLDDPDWDNFQIRLKEVVLLWKQVEDRVTGAGGAASGTASES
jgi:HEPN domain-containing protein